MKKEYYRIIFDDNSEKQIYAFTGIQAKILAQAERIEVGKSFAVHSIAIRNASGVFEELDISIE